MKFVSAALFFLALTIGGVAKAQSRVVPGKIHTAKSKKVNVSDPQSSWLFLLETRTQWLLVLQDTSATSGNSNLSADSTSSSAGDGGADKLTGRDTPQALGRVGGQNTSGNTSSNTLDSVKKAEPLKQSFIFEGNIGDLPLLKDPTDPKKPSSAPDS